MDEKQKWNDRYQASEFAFGTQPNVFFKTWISRFNRGNILMPADGEGRNGVYAAEQGWNVTAFDLSDEGKVKAMLLAKEKGVGLDYIVSDLDQLEFAHDHYDVIGLIYAHFTASKKSLFHQKLRRYLKPGGVIIFEAFSKEHLKHRMQNPQVGGPTDLDTLYSKEEILIDFENFEILHLAQEEIILEEGKYHIGKANVIRFVGRKQI